MAQEGTPLFRLFDVKWHGGIFPYEHVTRVLASSRDDAIRRVALTYENVPNFRVLGVVPDA